jgi:hypothetical protein
MEATATALIVCDLEAGIVMLPPILDGETCNFKLLKFTVL